MLGQRLTPLRVGVWERLIAGGRCVLPAFAVRVLVQARVRKLPVAGEFPVGLIREPPLAAVVQPVLRSPARVEEKQARSVELADRQEVWRFRRAY